MEALGLRYRFVCAVIDSRAQESIPQIIATTLPPPQQWWDNNWSLVNGSFIPGTNASSVFAFCGHKSNYSTAWPLIQLMYNWISKYTQTQYWYSSDETGVEFWTAVRNICQKVKSKCEDSSCKEITIFLEEIKQELLALASQADKPSKGAYTGPFRPYVPSRLKEYTPPVICLLNEIRFKLCGKKDLIKMYLFERYKLKDRLFRHILDGPPVANQLAWGRSN